MSPPSRRNTGLVRSKLACIELALRRTGPPALFPTLLVRQQPQACPDDLAGSPVITGGDLLANKGGELWGDGDMEGISGWHAGPEDKGQERVSIYVTWLPGLVRHAHSLVKEYLLLLL
jgi:hypothetical protein